MLDYLQEWNELPYPSVLGIFGPNKDRDSWVTEFSLDMIQAFQVPGRLGADIFDRHFRPQTDSATAGKRTE